MCCVIGLSNQIGGLAMRRLLFAAIILVFLLSPAAHAEKVKIMTGEWFPYVSESIDDFGFAAEVVTEAFASVGIDTEFEFAPWPRCESMVKYGKAFGAFPYLRNKKREQYAMFSDHIADSRFVFFYKKKGKVGKLQFDSLEELQKYKIAGAKGYFYNTIFRKYGLNIEYNLLVENSFKKLNLGAVDLVPEDSLVGWALIQKLFPGKKSRFSSSKEFIKDRLHIMVSKEYPGSAALMDKFNQGLTAIRQKGLYGKLVKKYSGDLKVSKKDDMIHRYYFK
jgi:polar amino acid transport system substrate-binding protein